MLKLQIAKFLKMRLMETSDAKDSKSWAGFVRRELSARPENASLKFVCAIATLIAAARIVESLSADQTGVRLGLKPSSAKLVNIIVNAVLKSVKVMNVYVGATRIAILANVKSLRLRKIIVNKLV